MLFHKWTHGYEKMLTTECLLAHKLYEGKGVVLCINVLQMSRTEPGIYQAFIKYLLIESYKKWEKQVTQERGSISVKRSTMHIDIEKDLEKYASKYYQ